ncbi:unnamed protein product [Paramecium sonneborni]|uniref:Transmembrane protein n=1 Tax=Paramecium sonneborni TaxID=65129 RepID=A0A8S1MQG6_9CILI|nr:unnamed protein product [Paramecium sonneborni]
MNLNLSFAYLITVMQTLFNSQFVIQLDEQYQYYSTPLTVNINNYQMDDTGIYGVWSRYIPLSTIKQIGVFGIMDSKCYHLNSAMEIYTKRINFIYFDCLNEESLIITKHLQFIDDQKQQHKFSVKIDPSKYEYFWYQLIISFVPQQNRFTYYIFQSSTIVEIQSLKIKFPYYDENLLLIFGGGLEIEETQQIQTDYDSNFSYYPGQISVLEFNQISLAEDQQFDYIVGLSPLDRDCICMESQNQIIPDIDINWLDQKSFTSTNINCDSFAFQAWIKITEYQSDKEEFLYQLMKLSSNFESSKLKDENLANFQLFYQISKQNNQIIITTYNYSFPYFNMDFIKNSFLIKKSFDIPKMTLWHFLSVILLENTIKFSITIYDGMLRTQLESIFKVNQFHMVQLKFEYGNIMKLDSNYFRVSLRNMKLLNCIYDEEYYPDQSCHYSCLECEGPTSNDCLSCSTESKRIYLAKYKICLCPYYMIDNEGCQDNQNYNLLLQQYENQQCNYGYFNYNQNCQRCPSIINDYVLTCLECLEQPQNWLNDPYCETNLYLDRDGSPAKIFKDSSKTYYVLYENDYKPQNFFSNDLPIKTEEIFADYLLTSQFFETNYKLINFTITPTNSSCHLFYCLQCGYEMTRVICLKCYLTSFLKDGQCIKRYTGQQKFNQCIAPYYKTSENTCKLCEIDNCIYCFEYLSNDLAKCTLYQGFQTFSINEYHRVGCALCKIDFIFDFEKGKCIYELPKIKNCLRAYNDLTGSQICTLSLIDDFSISPEIQNCNKYISHCKQCVQTPQDTLKCIICEDGYSSSFTTGQCSICSVENVKFCIDGDLKEQDSWIQLIQSFLMQFLPDKYFYSKSPSLRIIVPLPVKCIDGYEVNQSLCKKSCANNCEMCQKEIIPQNGFTCSKCKINKYMEENLRSLDQEKCLECPQLCQVCEKRTIQEIQRINPLFVIDENSYIFTLKCIKSFPYPNVVIDQISQTAKYCFEQNCNNYLKYEIENDCDYILSFFNTTKHEQFQNKLDFQYLNQIGLSIFQLILPYNQNCTYVGGYFSTRILYNLIKMKVFSLKLVELTLKGNNNPTSYFSNIATSDFDSISIVEVSFYVNQFFSLRFLNQNKSVNFSLQNSSIITSEDSKAEISIKSDLYDSFKIQNLTFQNLNVQNSFIFEINSRDFTLIDTIIIQNCVFDNTTLFYLLDTFKKVIQNLKIIGCKFYNSTIFNFTQNSNFYLQTQIKGIYIHNSQFYNSQILTSNIYVDFQITQSTIKNSQFNTSKFLIFSNNLNMVDLVIDQNDFFNSLFIVQISSVQNMSQIYFSDIKILLNSFSNSKVLSFEQQQPFYLLTILMSNFQLFENFQNQLITSKSYIFSINSYKLIINNITINCSKNINYFTLFNTYQIEIENLYYYSAFEKQKIKLSLKCLEEVHFNSHLLNIQGFTRLSIHNFTVQNQFNRDQPIISIYSNIFNLIEEQEIIQINNLQFIGNSLQKIKIGQLLSLIIIFSEKNQNISIKNIKFQENVLHQYMDDSSQNIASLFFIHSQQSYLYIQNLFSKNNILTNSSNTFINLFLNEIFISDLVVENHNLIQQDIWNKVFQIQLEQNVNQDQLNQIINKLLIIQNIGGALQIIAQQCQIINSSFKNLLAYKSLVINLKTQGKGIVNLKNLKMMHIYNINLNSTENDGSITIFSQYSLLNFQFVDIIFFDVLNNLGSSILALTPSSKQNKILIKNINIENCFSLLNLFLKAHFSTNFYEENQILIINQKIKQSKTSFIGYLKKLGTLNHFLTQNILQDNSIINLQGCSLSIDKFVIEGVILSSILKIEDSQQLKMNNFYIYKVELLFQVNLFQIVQKSIKTIFSLLNIVFQSITSFNLINIDLKYQFISIELQQLKCNLENITYSFYEKESDIRIFQEKVITFQNLNNFILFFQTQSNTNRIQLSQIQIFNNDLQNFLSGIIYFNLINYSEINIKDLFCFNNIINSFGCIFVDSNKQSNSIVKIWNSLFLKNNGGTGSAIRVHNTIFFLSNSKILNNTAKYEGGGLYISQENHQIMFNQTLIINNKANQAGGIFLNTFNTLNSINFSKSIVYFNQASLPPNNIQELPKFLELQINFLEMKSIQINIDGFQIQTLQINPYKVIEQGKLIKTKLLMLPSNQIIKDYQIFNTQLQSFRQYIEQITILFKNSMNEQLINFINSICEIKQQLGQNDNFHTIKSDEIKFDNSLNSFDLSTKSFSFDPLISDKFVEQILIGCKVDNSTQELQYRIQIKTFKCQLGEFYIEHKCQLCQPKQGYYSVTYNTTKCSIFDSKKFESITSNQIQLKIGYWRPNYLSDDIEDCFKFKESCFGGWMVGDSLCYQGHIGGLCEECDRFNVRGDGLFFKNQYNSLCYLCGNDSNHFQFFILASLWAIFSTLFTLNSIDKSNRLFSILKIRQRFARIIFKLSQDHASILLKLFLNYIWIFSVIFSFNIKFSFSFSFIDQTSNPSFFMANSLDCYLSEFQEIQLIYLRIITMFLLLACLFIAIYIGFKLYSLIKHKKFQTSFLSITALYIFVSNYPAFIKQFFSLLAKRQISQIDFIQGDVSLHYGTETHINWIISFIIPGLALIGIILPLSLLALLYFKRDQLENINLRKHICYLFNEYDRLTYYWEWIKLGEKTVIIIILTYFETDIYLKSSLLGMCLLFYQIYAQKHRPYIIQNLNNLDVQTGQICSIAIFLAVIKYITEQQNNIVMSLILQAILVIFFILLSYPFLKNIIQFYHKKYYLLFLINLNKLIKLIKISFLTKCLNVKIHKMNQKEQKLTENYAKLRNHLIYISKFQLEQQKSLTALLTSQSLVRNKLFSFDFNHQKILRDANN